jgi:DeoR/GlpR family transcriptional regulator of sugar metabolism
LLFDRESGFRRDPNDGRKPTARERVKELLEEDRELSTAQLVEITGFAERTVRKAVHDLDEGQLEL